MIVSLRLGLLVRLSKWRCAWTDVNCSRFADASPSVSRGYLPEALDAITSLNGAASKLLVEDVVDVPKARAMIAKAKQILESTSNLAIVQ
eukprot:8073813-Pyramimonas_sp.AAC.1